MSQTNIDSCSRLTSSTASLATVASVRERVVPNLSNKTITDRTTKDSTQFSDVSSNASTPMVETYGTESGDYNVGERPNFPYPEEVAFREITSDTVSSISLLGKRILRQYTSEFILPDDTRIAVSRRETTYPAEGTHSVIVTLACGLPRPKPPRKHQSQRSKNRPSEGGLNNVNDNNNQSNNKSSILATTTTSDEWTTSCSPCSSDFEETFEEDDFKSDNFHSASLDCPLCQSTAALSATRDVCFPGINNTDANNLANNIGTIGTNASSGGNNGSREASEDAKSIADDQQRQILLQNLKEATAKSIHTQKFSDTDLTANDRKQTSLGSIGLAKKTLLEDIDDALKRRLLCHYHKLMSDTTRMPPAARRVACAKGLRIADYVDDDPWAASLLECDASTNGELLRQLEAGCRLEPDAFRMERTQRRRNWETVVCLTSAPQRRTIGLSRAVSESDSIATATTLVGNEDDDDDDNNNNSNNNNDSNSDTSASGNSNGNMATKTGGGNGITRGVATPVEAYQ